jgi:hypothetical protein
MPNSVVLKRLKEAVDNDGSEFLEWGVYQKLFGFVEGDFSASDSFRKFLEENHFQYEVMSDGVSVLKIGDPPNFSRWDHFSLEDLDELESGLDWAFDQGARKDDTLNRKLSDEIKAVIKGRK